MSEATDFLNNLPVPKVSWLDRCQGDKRLTGTFTKGMGYTEKDLQTYAEKNNDVVEEAEVEEDEE